MCTHDFSALNFLFTRATLQHAHFQQQPLAFFLGRRGPVPKVHLSGFQAQTCKVRLGVLKFRFRVLKVRFRVLRLRFRVLELVKV